MSRNCVKPYAVDDCRKSAKEVKPNFTLADLVERYIQCDRPTRKRELDYYGSQGNNTLSDVLKKASTFRDHEAKKHSHQHRITLYVQGRFAHQLQNSNLDNPASFDQIHEWIKNECKVSGIGPLTCYDTALRIGSFFSLLPDKVFLHAGSAEGYRQLGNQRVPPFVDVKDLRQELWCIAPHEIENFLCIYKNCLVEAVGRSTTPGAADSR
jgi:hypothetical protein